MNKTARQDRQSTHFSSGTNSPFIWAVGGGKGGVGKSIVSILLSINLARRGHSTVLVDADLGAANLHTLMGIKAPARTLNDFLSRKYKQLQQICLNTQVDNLKLICGASEVLTMANLQYAQKTKIFRSIEALPADHVVLDLGAGASFNVLDFFLIAHFPLVVLTAQPVSIQNAYAFVRNAVYRRLTRAVSQKPSILELVKAAMDPKNENQLRTIQELLSAVEHTSGTRYGRILRDAVSNVRPLLITNMVRDDNERKAARIIKMVAQKYLTIEARDLGAIAWDGAVARAVSEMVPINELPEQTAAFKNTDRLIAGTLAQFEARRLN